MKHRADRPDVGHKTHVPRHRAETAQDDALSSRIAAAPNPDGTEGDVQRDRYTLTSRGLLALFPRREACGHIICKPLAECCLA